MKGSEGKGGQGEGGWGAKRPREGDWLGNNHHQPFRVQVGISGAPRWWPAVICARDCATLFLKNCRQLPCHNWSMLVIWRESGLVEVASKTVFWKYLNPAKGGACATAHAHFSRCLARPASWLAGHVRFICKNTMPKFGVGGCGGSGGRRRKVLCAFPCFQACRVVRPGEARPGEASW